MYIETVVHAPLHFYTWFNFLFTTTWKIRRAGDNVDCISLQLYLSSENPFCVTVYFIATI